MAACASTVGESALNVDSGEKTTTKTCRTEDSNPRQYCALAFQSDALLTELFRTSVTSYVTDDVVAVYLPLPTTYMVLLFPVHPNTI